MALVQELDRFVQRLGRIPARLRRELALVPLPGGRYFSLANRGFIQPRVNLVVIGAGKCATTSLHHWLDQHPDIFMTKPIKEAEFFLPREIVRPRRAAPPPPRTNMRNRMLEGYRREPILGEASPSYTAEQFWEDNPIPARLRAHAPDAKLIYTLRNPYERIISHYQKDVHVGVVPNGLEVIPDADFERYLRCSCYGRQLNHWRQHFDASAINIVVLEEYRHDPAPMMQDMAEFLGVAPFPEAAHFHALNVTRHRPEAPREVLLTPAQRRRARAMIEPDVKILELMCGRSFSSVWGTGTNGWTTRGGKPYFEPDDSIDEKIAGSSAI